MHQRRTASVICFLSSEGVKPIEIHRRMKVQYGDACLSLQQVYEWTRKFMNGISSVTGCPRPGARVAALSAIGNFFLEVLMHFRNAGTLV